MNTVYILKLEDNKYYVGKTENINKRVLEHFTNNGSEWTKKYKPIEIINKYKSDDNIYEQRYTWETMVKYGIDNVRGAAHCKIELADSEKEYIKQCINSITDKCYKCGIKGHFAKECDNINTKNNDKILRKNEEYKNFISKCKGNCEFCNNTRIQYQGYDGEDEIYVSCIQCYCGDNWEEDMFVRLHKR